MKYLSVRNAENPPFGGKKDMGLIDSRVMVLLNMSAHGQLTLAQLAASLDRLLLPEDAATSDRRRRALRSYLRVHPKPKPYGMHLQAIMQLLTGPLFTGMITARGQAVTFFKYASATGWTAIDIVHDDVCAPLNYTMAVDGRNLIEIADATIAYAHA